MPTRHSTIRGIFMMLAAQMFFVASWTAIKYLGNRLPLFEIVFFRGAIPLLILLPITYFSQKTLRGNNWTNIFVAAFAGFMAMTLAFYAMINTQLGNVATLLNTLPIFVAFLAPLVLKEPFKQAQFIFVIIAFAGITMILKPTVKIFQSVSIYAVFAGFFAALSLVYVRKLRTTDSVYIIAFYFTLFATIVSAPLAFRKFVMPTQAEVGWLIFMGVGLTFAQLCLTKAFHDGHAATIAPFGYLSVIASYISGLIFFSEIPDMWSFIGAVIIISCGIAIIRLTPRRTDGDSAPGVRT